MIEYNRADLDNIYRMVRILDAGAARQISDAAYEAAKMIQTSARAMVPVKSGALQSSIRPRRKGGSAQVTGGGTAKVVYAKVIHFGSPRRNIKPNKFMFRGADANLDQAAEKFMLAVEDIWNEVMS